MRPYFVRYVALFVAACFLATCEGDVGPTGPAGAAGPAGPTGDPGCTASMSRASPT